jgi:hypothetical protein
LITKNTLEEKILGLQKFKLKTANSVITKDNSSLSSMATDQVFDLFSLDEANDINDTSGKVKKIEDTLDSIPSPSPSVKIQKRVGFFLWRVEFFKIGKRGLHVY